MSVVKVKGGYKIKSHTSGKIYPKVYKSKNAARRRIMQMKFHKKRG